MTPTENLCSSRSSSEVFAKLSSAKRPHMQKYGPLVGDAKLAEHSSQGQTAEAHEMQCIRAKEEMH